MNAFLSFLEVNNAAALPSVRGSPGALSADVATLGEVTLEDGLRAEAVEGPGQGGPGRSSPPPLGVVLSFHPGSANECPIRVSIILIKKTGMLSALFTSGTQFGVRQSKPVHQLMQQRLSPQHSLVPPPRTDHQPPQPKRSTTEKKRS